jgi:hypothetical protein
MTGSFIPQLQTVVPQMNPSPAVDNSRSRAPRTVTASRSQRSPWRALDHVQAALVGMQYGQVTVIVQDGLIVQVERTERTRLAKSSANPQ